jgi:glycosyl transferase family 25
MKTFVISLKRAVERRQFMIEQMNRLGLDYEIFDAIDGQLLTENDISHYFDVNTLRNPNGYYASNGMLGCTLSHYSVLKKIVEEGLESALILEDDALLPLNIKDILSELEREIKKNEVITLFYTSHKIIKLSLVGGKAIKSGKLLFPINIKDVAAATAYVVHKEAAKGIIKVDTPIRTTSDSWHDFYNYGGITSLRCLYPPPIQTANFKSTLDYIAFNSLIGKCTAIIDEYKIPVLYHLLTYKRKLLMKGLSKYELVNEVSPIYEKLIAGENTKNTL